MSRIRLYIDEDAAERAVVEGLRRGGVDAITVLEAGRAKDTDEEQLAFAANEARVVYTFNVDHFSRLHRDFLSSGREHAGIVVIPRQRYSTGEKIRRLLSLVDDVTAEEMKNRLEYL
jgi:predicted nuclease of predicted toxin-antitoxin system